MEENKKFSQPPQPSPPQKKRKKKAKVGTQKVRKNPLNKQDKKVMNDGVD
jgi:hypothetical protein